MTAGLFAPSPVKMHSSVKTAGSADDGEQYKKCKRDGSGS